MSRADLLRSAVKALASGVDVVRPRRAGVVVLIYHSVGGASGLQLDLPKDLFARQMSELAAAGNVVPLDVALAQLEQGRPDPGRECVVLTFDDGTVDFVEHAVPVLAEHGLPATLYVATAFVEEQRPFDYGVRPLSWNALADACTTGLVDVGSHTHTHALLDRVDPAVAADELDRSIALIEDRLGRPARDFAYPKAVPASHAVEAAVRARFRSAALAGTRPNRPGATDPHRLARSPIQAADGLVWFRRKAAGGMALEDDLRRLLNRTRYAGRVS
ncbi:MAG: hypothetical protein KatS3mg010_0584 [Acidimicrobiia bacterium]|nr:MAG: hypothetical protein KatS3mg010_0584 [Acidimicrobiia bacterium]